MARPLRLKALREARRLSQTALADKAGLSREYVARLEAGRQDPRVSVMVRLARALGTTLDDLVGLPRTRQRRVTR